MNLADEYSEQNRARLAVFDFDGTLISGQSGFLLFRYLLSRGFLTATQASRLSWWGIRYATHLPKRQEEPREIIFSALAGRTPEEVGRIMDDFYETVLKERYRALGKAEVERRRREGCVTLLVSATVLAATVLAAAVCAVVVLVAEAPQAGRATSPALSTAATRAERRRLLVW